MAARRPGHARGTSDGLDVLRAHPEGWRDGSAAEARVAGGGRSRLQVAQATDGADWLPHDLLLALDRCPMAHGVLFYMLWHRAHVSGRPSADGVFDEAGGTNGIPSKRLDQNSTQPSARDF